MTKTVESRGRPKVVMGTSIIPSASGHCVIRGGGAGHRGSAEWGGGKGNNHRRPVMV